MPIKDVLSGEITRVPISSASLSAHTCAFLFRNTRHPQLGGAAIISLPPPPSCGLKLSRLPNRRWLALSKKQRYKPLLEAYLLPSEVKKNFRKPRCIITECRRQDTQSSALIAAQLCHSVAVADKAYAMKSRVSISGRAVHVAKIVQQVTSAQTRGSDHARFLRTWDSGEGEMQDLALSRGGGRRELIMREWLMIGWEQKVRDWGDNREI